MAKGNALMKADTTIKDCDMWSQLYRYDTSLAMAYSGGGWCDRPPLWSDQSLYILIHKPGSRQVAILAVYVGTTVA